MKTKYKLKTLTFVINHLQVTHKLFVELEKGLTKKLPNGVLVKRIQRIQGRCHEAVGYLVDIQFHLNTLTTPPTNLQLYKCTLRGLKAYYMKSGKSMIGGAGREVKTTKGAVTLVSKKAAKLLDIIKDVKASKKAIQQII